jgi:ribosomal protein S18 acetylase RimI-like enzyme
MAFEVVMRSDHTVGPLVRSNVDLAAAAMARAFHDYPLFLWLRPDLGRRIRYIQWFMHKALEYGLRYGRVYSDAGTSSAAVWLPPGKTTMTFDRLVRSGFALVPFKLGLSGAFRFIAFNSAAEKIHKAYLSSGHWYLLMIGVDPSQQHAGIGTALIEQGVRRADAQALPCYLETHVESNVRYFQKHGFRLVEKAELLRGGPHNWAMIRDPQA